MLLLWVAGFAKSSRMAKFKVLCSLLEVSYNSHLSVL